MLNNVEKEKLVIDLYYNRRKNVRQMVIQMLIEGEEVEVYF